MLAAAATGSAAVVLPTKRLLPPWDKEWWQDSNGNGNNATILCSQSFNMARCK
jgi:hypothetical protein